MYYVCMDRLFLLTVILLTGCASMTKPVPMPDSVAILGEDCSNSRSFIEWRQRQLAKPQGVFERDADYKQKQSYYKHEIWRIRYNCQR